MADPLIDIGAIATIVGLVISVIALYLDHRKTKKELEATKQYIKILSELVESYKLGIQSQQELENQKLQWKRLEALAKGLGWVIEHAE